MDGDKIRREKFRSGNRFVSASRELSEAQTKHGEAILQVEDLRVQCAELKAKLEAGSRSNLGMRSDLAKLASQLEHSEMARSILEKECMALREHTNHSTTLIQSECSQMQVQWNFVALSCDVTELTGSGLCVRGLVSDMLSFGTY